MPAHRGLAARPRCRLAAALAYHPPFVALRRPSARVVLALAALTATLLSACSSGGATVANPAATVNGVTVSSQDVDAVLRDALVIPPGTLSVPTAESTSVLNFVVEVELLRQGTTEKGIEPTEEDRTAAQEGVYQLLGGDAASGLIDPEAGKAVFEEMDPVTRRLLVDQALYQTLLAGTIADEDAGIVPITDDDVRAVFESRQGEYRSRCLSLLAVDPELGPVQAGIEAQELYDRLDGGEDIAALVAEVNEGRPEGSELAAELGCFTDADISSQVAGGQWPTELADAVSAAAGVGPIEPLALPDGLTYVFHVDREEVTPFEEAAAGIRSELEAANEEARQGLLAQIVAELGLAADVWVDPRHGRWMAVDEAGAVTNDAELAVRAMVVPPAGPQDPPVDVDDTVADPLAGLGVTGTP